MAAHDQRRRRWPRPATSRSAPPSADRLDRPGHRPEDGLTTGPTTGPTNGALDAPTRRPDHPPPRSPASRRRPRLLRRPRDGQHQVVLGRAQGHLRRRGEGADDAPWPPRSRTGVRHGQGVPPLPRRALRQGQDALQDPPGRLRRGRPGDRLVRRGLRAAASASAPGSTRPARPASRRSGRRSTTTSRGRAGADPRASSTASTAGTSAASAQDHPARLRRGPPAHRASTLTK